MKKIKLLFLSLAVYSSIYSQGNLQFNRVINLSYPKVYAVSWSTTAITFDTLIVPPNKVWKIESAWGNFDVHFGGYLLRNHDCSNTLSVLSSSNFPIWFSTGSYILNGTTCSPSSAASAYVSIIEFNIVP